jgi:exosome complex component RRP43
MADTSARLQGVGEAAAAFQRLQPRAFFERFAAQGVRPDGRGLGEARLLTVRRGAVGSADGSARCALGATEVVCGVRFLVGPPRRARVGEVQVSVRLSPVCSPAYEYGRAPEQAFALGGFLQRLAESMVDLEALVIAEGLACFHLLVDVVCLSDDGNVADASLAALVAALEDLRLPKVAAVDDGAGAGDASAPPEFVQLGEERPDKVRFRFRPTATSFGLFGDRIVVDPTHEEMAVLDGAFTVVVTDTGAVAGVYKASGPPLAPADLDACIETATERAARPPRGR